MFSVKQIDLIIYLILQYYTIEFYAKTKGDRNKDQMGS